MTETLNALKLGDEELLKIGIIRVPVPSSLNCVVWAQTLAVVTPLNAASEDGEYAFYRNIIDDPDFPFSDIVHECSDIGKAIVKYFNLSSLEEIRLDDAFIVHYNMSQLDTTCAKHIDPSDITVNICLEKSTDCEGNQVVFYGAQNLPGLDGISEPSFSGDETDSQDQIFMVEQEQGFATIHFGHHPHRTLDLSKGHRTNVVLTFCYKDKRRSDVQSRLCYSIK
jgi:hypothetical protein